MEEVKKERAVGIYVATAARFTSLHGRYPRLCGGGRLSDMAHHRMPPVRRVRQGQSTYPDIDATKYRITKRQTRCFQDISVRCHSMEWLRVDLLILRLHLLGGPSNRLLALCV